MPVEPMLPAKKTKSIVGLDIEAGSAAAAEVEANGSVKMLKHGVIALDPGVFDQGEVTNAEALGEALKELFSRNKLSRNVRLGIANQRVAVRVLRLPALDGAELESAIRFQAQDHIPMPLDQAVLDWQIVNREEDDAGRDHIDVVVVAARRDMLAAMLDALRRAGLRPVGIDHSAFGMIRALNGARYAPVGTPIAASMPQAPPAEADEPTPPEADEPTPPEAVQPGIGGVAPTEVGLEAASPGVEAEAPPAEPGKLYCNLADATNLAVTLRSACMFTRISPFGVDAIAQRLAERQELSVSDAHDWLVRVGLEANLEQLEGEPERIAAARETLNEGVAKLADELRMSLDFYAAQEGAIPVDGVVACGWGATIPGLVGRLQQEVGRPFEIARPTALEGLDEVTSARLTLPYGIALEE